MLADVYINLTRGQDALLVDLDTEDHIAAGNDATARIDFSTFQLGVLTASDEETAAHDAVLKQIDKACGGESVWRRTEVADKLLA